MTPHEWAMAYVDRGWRVMPCHWMMLDENFDRSCSCGAQDCGSPGKHPRPRRGSHDATLSGQQVDGWWRSIWPKANIGIATGQASDLYVIDLDGQAAIDEWAALELAHGDAPTLTCRTGGGGQHRYYKLPPRLRLANTAKRIAPHIDSRGDGGYVLAPPSNHRSGRDYEWANWPTVPAPIPPWLGRMLIGVPDAPRRAPAPIRRGQDDDPVAIRILTDEARTVAETQPGSRNEQLFKSAASVFSIVMGGDLRIEAAWAAMEEAGLACGLTQAEVSRTINSAVDAAKSTPRRIRTRQLGGAS